MWADEGFQGLLLRFRGRAGLTQPQLAGRVGVHMRSVQDWESGTNYPSAARLQSLIAALLDAGGLVPGREVAEAEALWAAVLRKAPRMHTPFDPAWFADLLNSRNPALAPANPTPGKAQSTIVSAHTPPETANVGVRRHDWGEAPDVLGFQGRRQELTTLHAWLTLDRCRVAALVGIGGVGKTMLAARVARDLAPSLDLVFWRSLRNAPPFTDWLRAAIALLSDHLQVAPDSESAALLVLLDLLRDRRCLLVLDNFETVLEPDQRDTGYRDGYAGFARLLQLAAETSHQSCLLVTSREMPPDLELQGDAGIRRLELHGLGPLEARALLADKHLTGETQAWVSLVERYGGRGLALKMVGETIRQVFDGEITNFLEETGSGTVFRGIRRLLDSQFDRLPEAERVVLTWLAVERESVNLAALTSDIGPGVSRSAVVQAIETLRRRSLVERGERGATFTLQSMVLEYVTDRLVETVADEIEHSHAVLLTELPLIKAQSKDYVRQTQERLIGAASLQHMKAQRGEAGTESRLRALLDGWRDRLPAEQGYGPGNVVNLLRLLRGDLRGMDLSRLALRQVYLQGVDAQDASLAGAHLAGAVLDEAFAYPTAVALSADGALLVAGTPTGEVRLWRAADRTLLRTAHGHSDMVWGVALSADGRLLASGGDDGMVKLWDTESSVCLRALRSDRHYQRLDITGLTRVTEAQRAALLALGATTR